MANEIGTVNPANPNYIMGAGGKWVRKSTTGAKGLNPMTPIEPVKEMADAGTASSLTNILDNKNILGDMLTDFDLGNLGTIPSDVFGGMRTNADINKLLADQATLRESLISSLKPTAEENQFSQQLADIQNKIQTSNLSTKAGIQAAGQRVAPRNIVLGEQRNIAEQGQLELQTLGIEESNLLNRLGLAQEARQASLNATQVGLSLISQDLDLQFKVQQAIDTKEQQLFQNVMTLRTDAQNRLGTILKSFEGLTFDKLDTPTQLQLATLAQQVGIPVDILKQGMEVVADKLALESLKDSELNELLTPSEAKALGVTYGTTKGQAAMMGITQTDLESVSGLTEDQIQYMFTIQNNIRQDADIKGFIEIRDSYNRIKASVDNPSPAGDLALIFNYMKMLDPSSTVREGEFANAENSGSISDKIRKQYNKILEGERLSDSMRKDFIDRAEKLYKPKLESYNDAYEFYASQADTFGIPTNLILRDFTGNEVDVDTKLQTLQPIYQSFQSIDDLKIQLSQSDPYYSLLIDSVLEEKPNATVEEVLEDINFLISGDVGFNQVGSDTNSAIQDLTIGNKTVKVNSSIANKLAMADKEFYKATKKHLQINQSYRTTEEQARLYKELSAKGARVAPPGQSFHEKGLAIDITNWQEAEPYLRKYGFKNNLADDKGHFSIGEFA